MAIDPTIVEAFVVDPGFADQSKTINGILINEAGAVATLTPKALSYFNQPSMFKDTRAANTRTVGWPAQSQPAIVVDKNSYSQFTTVINAMSPTVASAFFKLVDKLIFNYDSALSLEDLEDDLLLDGDINDIYVPGSFKLSATIVEDDIYFLSGSTTTTEVPSFVSFRLTLPQGAGTTTYSLTLFTSIDAFLTGYDVSTIVKVIPPLPYQQLFNASLVSSNDSIFSTASVSATLSYNTSVASLGTIAISGITEYSAVLVDGGDNTVSVPFNILYKGRRPTLLEIREAIKDVLLASGVGNAETWEARIPGVFVAGRFYLVPYWDLIVTKPDQIIFPSIATFNTLGEKVNTILESTGFGDLLDHLDVLSVYYNRMTVGAVPDLTGLVDINPLISIIPDYQNYSTDDENFAYMDAFSQEFATKLNYVLTVDNGAAEPGVYVPVTENLLSFYSFVVGKYEMCVITKACYETIMESVQ